MMKQFPSLAGRISLIYLRLPPQKPSAKCHAADAIEVFITFTLPLSMMLFTPNILIYDKLRQGALTTCR